MRDDYTLHILIIACGLIDRYNYIDYKLNDRKLLQIVALATVYLFNLARY